MPVMLPWNCEIMKKLLTAIPQHNPESCSILETLSWGARGQPYFPNNTKMFFVLFFVLIKWWWIKITDIFSQIKAVEPSCPHRH